MFKSKFNRLLQSGIAVVFATLLMTPANFANAQNPTPPPKILISPAPAQGSSLLGCTAEPDNPALLHCQSGECVLPNMQPETSHGGHFLRIYPAPSSICHKLTIIEPDPLTDYKIQIFPALPRVPDIELLRPELLP